MHIRIDTLPLMVARSLFGLSFLDVSLTQRPNSLSHTLFPLAHYMVSVVLIDPTVRSL